MKVILTEKQFDEYINYLIKSSFIFEGKDKPDAPNKKDIDVLQKHLGQNIKSQLDMSPELRATAQEIGINPNFSREGERDARAPFTKDMSNLKDKIVSSALILSKFVSNKGYFDFKAMKQEYPNDYNFLLRMREFLDSKGLEYLYDIDEKPEPKRRKFFGYNDNDKTIEDRLKSFNLDVLGNISDYNNSKKPTQRLLTDEEATAKMQESILNNYMEKTYGLGVNLPSGLFSNGNDKLPPSTLIVNFVAAQQCPAWNECLLRNACYAKRGEKQHTNVRNANVQRNLMWEAGRHDENLLNMIFTLLRLHCIDYTNALPEIQQIGGKYAQASVQSLAKQKFSDLDEDVLDILKRHTVIKHIRLNENGDFIGQWILDTFDAMAGDFLIMGISTSAYTCRNFDMDYSKVANIILNVSNANIKGGKAIARYFYAIGDAAYNAFDETYYGQEDGLKINSTEQIQPEPQPLYYYDKKTGEILENGFKYYKCPCGRPTTDGEKVSCYQCDICYQPNTISDKPYYVLVKAHSGAEQRMKNARLVHNIPNFGFSANYLANMGIEKPEQKRVAESRELIREDIARNMKDAIIQVGKNCLNSVL